MASNQTKDRAMIHVDKLQLVFFFLISYLLSRVFVRFELPKRLVWWLIEEKHITISKLSWFIIFGTTLLSMLIANVVTLMTMIPVLELVQKQYRGSPKNESRFGTLMILSAVWGANIGGMGMLTGTTTNGILVALYEAYKFPISRQFTFLSWMTWAMPLSFILCLGGWLILMRVFNPKSSMKGGELRSELCCEGPISRGERISIILAIIFISSATLLSTGVSLINAYQNRVAAEECQAFNWLQNSMLILSIVWTLAFLYIFFIHKFRLEDGKPRGILLPKEYILHDLPRKGLLWIAAGGVVTLILVTLKVPKAVAGLAVTWITNERSAFLLLLIVGAIATFATELMSNTVIQIAMFISLFPLTKVYPDIGWQTMLVITLTSGCAFMSPIATPSNGLGFGSIKKLSLPHMLTAGMLMNIFSLVAITAWVNYVVPIVLTWFA